ncbi:MAG: helix-turn-helix domain-containing protein [Elusimicrobia bacterium]|nr:helix-turn-helix domain-containing protein [Elusimicrobiota bacterium]
MEKRILTVDELSDYLSTPVPTLYTWTHQRKIPHIKLGRGLRFDRIEIDKWLDARKVESAPRRELARQ